MESNPRQPSYHMLISLIEVWAPTEEEKDDPTKLLAPDRTATFMMSEVESLEIRESYQDICGGTSIKFPRGAIIRKTLDSLNVGIYADAVQSSVDGQGVVIEQRSNSSVAQVTNFGIGSRIRIWLGYTEDYKVYRMTKIERGRDSIYTSPSMLADYKGYLTPMFDGYITKCSIDNPIELECENLAHVLKRITCKKISTNATTTIQQLLLPKGTKGGLYGLLKDSGLELDSKTEEITIGRCTVDTDYTLFDVLNALQHYKIFSYLTWENGKPCIAVRRAYFQTIDEHSLVSNSRDTTHTIDFAYNVAQNSLTLENIDKRNLAVRAVSKSKDGKQDATLTLMPNPQWKPGDNKKEQWRVQNKSVKTRKRTKKQHYTKTPAQSGGGDQFRITNDTKVSGAAASRNNVKTVSEGSSKANLSNYIVIDYVSRKIGLTHDQLLEEAIAFYTAYNANGIEGTLTVFGDFPIHTTDIVQLQDKRFSQKNGKYLVEEVVTKFGTSGYRQTIKIPYCLKRDNQSNN